MKMKGMTMKMKRNTKAAVSNRVSSRSAVINSGTLRSLARRSNECNLQKLEQLGILDSFVKDNNGIWDHQKWISLCELIENHDLGPVDFDKVGLILEEKKSRHFSSKVLSTPEYANLTA